MRLRAVFAVTVLTLLLGASAHAKSLYWRSVAVDAHLDAEGRMHIVETQTYVFDGDWNGGERTFNVYGNQSLNFEQLTRVDRDGTETQLVMAPLDKVDHYQILDGPKVRWRSRLTTDPEFKNTELTYRLRYTLSGIVKRINKRYLLSHDFAFPNRESGQVIQNFSVHFTVDPIWSGIRSPYDASVTNLQPGHGYVVNATLQHHGSRAPVAVPYGAPSSIAWGMALLFALGVAALVFDFLRREKARGRFVCTPLEQIDERWLEENVLRFEPEIVGAAIDNKIGAPEVAAILAALAKEKKIETRVEQRRLKRPLLHMKLLVPITAIEGHRHALLKRLFFKGQETDTDAIRNHYEKCGFEPAALIRKGIEGELAKWPKWNEKFASFNWKLDVALIVAGIVLFSLFGTGGNDGAFSGECLFFGAIALVGLIAAHLNSRALTSLVPRFILVGAFAAPLVYVTLHYTIAAPDFAIHTRELLLAAFWSLAVVKILLDKLRTDESDERIAARMRLASAFRYFCAQLATPNPHLRDDWYPYLMAFGLGANVDTWFKAHGGAAAASGGALATTSSSSSSFGSSSSGGGGWAFSGGGGAFGGAGASASWAVAAGGIASGVASPSSGGSGGGGGGGGGGSSGGGGGGGW
jgi:uncharacterized membrane protein YgcG